VKSLKYRFRELLCAAGYHVYESAADRGEVLDKQRAKDDPSGYFWEYTRLTCKYCGRLSDVDRVREQRREASTSPAPPCR
jgi:hypothetical protein